MQIEANRRFKVLYCINFAQFTTIPLAYGVIMNILWGLKMTPDYFGRAVFCLLVFMLSGYRIYSVVRNPKTLTFFSAHSFAKAIRSFSIFLMWVGVLAIPSLIIFGTVSFMLEANWLIAMGYIAIFWLGFTVGAGFIGFILFEATRLITIWTS